MRTSLIKIFPTIDNNGLLKSIKDLMFDRLASR